MYPKNSEVALAQHKPPCQDVIKFYILLLKKVLWNYFEAASV